MPMEARDSGSRIRPLPIDDLDGDAPRRPVEPRRRIAPLVVIILGALAFGVIARGLSAGDPDTVGAGTPAPPTTLAEQETTTTTTTRPPPPPQLVEMLPIVARELRLVAINPSSASVGWWAPDSATPVYNARISQAQGAEYNVDGSLVAVYTQVRSGSVVIDHPRGGSPVYIQEDVTGGAWHPEDPSLFAWSTYVGGEDEGTTIIQVADLTGASAAAIQPLVGFTVAGNHTLRAWGDWGFATTAGGTTVGLDSDGFEIRRADALFYDASVEGTLLLGAPDDEAVIPFLFDSSGAITDLPSLDIGAGDFHITADGQWVFAITIQADGHTSVLARTVFSRSTRLSSIDAAASVVGFVWDDQIIVLQEDGSNDLIFKNWNTGAEFRVPLESRIAAVFLLNGLAN